MTTTSLHALEDFISKALEQPIQLLLRNRFYPAALVLTFSAIDTMAYLAMPARKLDVMRSDFIDWTEKYISFEGSRPSPTAQDLYGARCGILHGQGTACRRTREGMCRPIRFVFGEATPADMVRESNRTLDSNPASLELEVGEFAEAFIQGAKRFLSALSEDPRRLQIAYDRVGEIVGSMPGN